ncbi:hypothetical protein ACJJTC_010676 [Scirpophaga incertulas]
MPENEIAYPAISFSGRSGGRPHQLVARMRLQQNVTCTLRRSPLLKTGGALGQTAVSGILSLPIALKGRHLTLCSLCAFWSLLSLFPAFSYGKEVAWQCFLVREACVALGGFIRADKSARTKAEQYTVSRMTLASSDTGFVPKDV